MTRELLQQALKAFKLLDAEEYPPTAKPMKNIEAAIALSAPPAKSMFIDRVESQGSEFVAEMASPAKLKKLVNTWIKGVPPHPYDKEWFIAKTVFGPVVLIALPEDNSYDFKTVDETYFLAHKIAAWMQLPDSKFLEFAQPEPLVATQVAFEAEQKETRRKHHEDYEALHDAVTEVAALKSKVAELEIPPPPHECKTDGEKTAYAFGWWKALETARPKREALFHLRQYGDVTQNQMDEYLKPGTSSSPMLRLSKSWLWQSSTRSW